MKQYLEIQGRKVPIDGIRERRYDADWSNRASVEIRLTMPHAEADQLFQSDRPWKLTTEWGEQADPVTGETYTPDPQVVDYGEYSVAGDIIDHRDGTLTIKMGQATDRELLEILTGERK